MNGELRRPAVFDRVSTNPQDLEMANQIEELLPDLQEFIRTLREGDATTATKRDMIRRVVSALVA